MAQFHRYKGSVRVNALGRRVVLIPSSARITLVDGDEGVEIVM